MKKKMLFLVLGSLFSLGLFGVSSAEVATYVFQGEVTSIQGYPSSEPENAALVADKIAVGDPMEFTFECDLDADGTQTRYSGQVIVRQDNYPADYFWCDYISGTDIGPIGDILYPDPNQFAELNYGLSNTNLNSNTDAGYMYGGPTYNQVWITNYSTRVEDWQLGGGYTFQHRVFNQDLKGAWIHGNLELVYTTAGNPDPEKEVKDLVSLVVTLNIQTGLSNSFDSKLETALSALDDLNDNNDVAAINSLYAFINSVEAQSGKNISTEDANTLIQGALDIIATLETL